ncbi:SHOCT domain-containing protein [Caloramator sp. Dgby_cultured_2]|uniref:SHOCT domain-containing protein n=1 Tax=Caloramator sp. Dgby_cultured_2 TaxID=3029174 RepID=UPI00237DA0EB|nr:SHOCT domain-containing protein [Caloramator sp. Dgby_cultured_2]WDU83306.1 SHOCT domain-containing protein [Caloramator sp. Dgby_cultured_2]
MGKKIIVKQSKEQAIFSMIVGLIFVIIGITIAIPNFGLFGIFWTLIAFLIFGSSVYNVINKRGLPSWSAEIEDNIELNEDFETKLRKLNRLKEDGLITEEEFQIKREEIMKAKW